MKIDGFDWDEGNWPKCAKHGLSKHEIEDVLSGHPLVLPDRNPVAGEARFNAVGKNRAGRHIFTVFTLRMKGTRTLLRAISARYMHDKEIRIYEQQTRKT